MHSNRSDFRSLTQEIERRVRWSRAYLEADRKLMWRPEFVNLLYTYLDIRPKMHVADIGSGTGFLADLIAPRIGDNGLVTRIDQDKELLIPVPAESRQENRRSIYSIQADAYNCPVRSSWADLAACQYLLSNVSRPLSIIREMVRITK